MLDEFWKIGMGLRIDRSLPTETTSVKVTAAQSKSFNGAAKAHTRYIPTDHLRT